MNVNCKHNLPWTTRLTRDESLRSHAPIGGVIAVIDDIAFNIIVAFVRFVDVIPI